MLDLIVIAIILISCIMGMKLGFIRTVYQLVSSLVAFVLAMVIYPIIETILKLTPIDEVVKGWVQILIPSMESSMGLQAQGSAIYEVTKWMPEFIADKIVANNNPEIYEILGVTKFVDYVVVAITNLCIAGLAIIIGWVLVKIILSIGISILDLVSRLPILKTANQLAGGIAGFVKGLLIIWLGCILIPFLSLVPNFGSLQQWLDASNLTKILYENNLLLQVIIDLLFK